jgi:glycosyltransferase involved in cell wall biosynthesis
MADLIKDNKEGFVIPIRDVEAIKEKILYFYNNPNEIKRMGINAHKLAQDYTFEKYGENKAIILANTWLKKQITKSLTKLLKFNRVKVKTEFF